MREIAVFASIVLMSLIMLATLLAILSFDEKHFGESIRCKCNHEADYQPPGEI